MVEKILITGGAGYIGATMAQMASEAGYEVIVLDNLSTGHKKLLRPHNKFIQADLRDYKELEQILEEIQPYAIMHFAGSISVGESVEFPDLYYENNIISSLNLFSLAGKLGVKNIIFSSTAAVYGNAADKPIKEEDNKSPINPYGHSKLMAEQFLQDISRQYGFNYGILRYFNAAGAYIEQNLGEMHEPETHLIPLILQAASGKRESINIFGNDYATKDGTCIRDFIHVKDLCQAHLDLLKYIENGTSNDNIFNVGSSDGFSVKEVIDIAKEVTEIDFKTEIKERRDGDPAILVADSSKARKALNWQPKYSSLRNIIQDAWEWEKRL